MNKKKKRTSLYSQTYRLDELTYMHSRLMRVSDEEYYKVEDDFFDKQYQADKLELQNQEKEEYEELLMLFLHLLRKHLRQITQNEKMFGCRSWKTLF